MKLFTKYSRINVVATIVVFLVASTAFYFTLRIVFLHQIDQDLKIEEKEIATYVKEHNRLPESISVNDQLIHSEPSITYTQRHFSTKWLIEPGDHEKEKFRQLIFGIQAANQWYRVTVSKSLEETDALTQNVLFIVFVTILIILLVSFIINRVVLKRIWRPFYQSLDSVKDFKVGSNRPLHLSSSDIDEFQLMNETLIGITSKAQLDYLSLKTFSENASHEIQTPLAVIRSKLDLMIQDEDFTQKQSESLQAAYNSLQKLTKLNQSLLLLAKIENKQFYETSLIDICKKVDEKITDFHELWVAQELSVEKELKEVTITMNEELLDVLLNNLFSNATKYNFNGGKIQITVNEKFLAIANTSQMRPLDAQTLYQRFTKLSNGNESNGLGLSIIKQICESSGFGIIYQYHEGLHLFTINWH